MRPDLCVDAGHGGPPKKGLNFGASGHDLIEKDVSLEIALLMHEMAPSKVALTRSSDVNMSIPKRARIANRSKARRVISIHCNGYKKSSARGYETFYASGSSRGKAFGSCVHSAMMRGAFPEGMPDRGLKARRFTILTNTKAPCILIELGFLTNIYDAEIIKADDFLEKTAKILLVACGVIPMTISPKPMIEVNDFSQELADLKRHVAAMDSILNDHEQ